MKQILKLFLFIYLVTCSATVVKSDENNLAEEEFMQWKKDKVVMINEAIKNINADISRLRKNKNTAQIKGKQNEIEKLRKEQTKISIGNHPSVRELWLAEKRDIQQLDQYINQYGGLIGIELKETFLSNRTCLIQTEFPTPDKSSYRFTMMNLSNKEIRKAVFEISVAGKVLLLPLYTGTEILTLNLKQGQTAECQIILPIRYESGWSSGIHIVSIEYIDGTKMVFSDPVAPIYIPKEYADMYMVNAVRSEDVDVSQSAKQPEPVTLSESEKDTKQSRWLCQFSILDSTLPKNPKLGEHLVMKINGVEFAFRYCPAGEFVMGSPENDSNRSKDEKFFGKQQINEGYYIGEVEVTQEQWEMVMKSNPSKWKGKNLPVENLSWYDSQEFVRKLNEIIDDKDILRGCKFALPTEAQWEYACRAGSTTAYCFGNDIGQLGEYAWYDANDEGKTHPVAKKKANAWGIYDMHGNVCEYTSTLWGDDDIWVIRRPRGPEDGYGNIATNNRSASDCGVNKRERRTDNGLRLVLETERYALRKLVKPLKTVK